MYKKLFDIKRAETDKNPEGEFMEYTKSKFLIDLPRRNIVLPREKAPPKVTPMTKWEKFRKQKGLPPRKKRSALVYDEITKEWVPRWGPYSVKHIEDKAQWLIEEKDNNKERAIDSFTEVRQKKKMVIAKEKLKQMKNTLWAAKQEQKKSRDPSATVEPRDKAPVEKVQKVAAVEKMELKQQLSLIHI